MLDGFCFCRFCVYGKKKEKKEKEKKMLWETRSFKLTEHFNIFLNTAGRSNGTKKAIILGIRTSNYLNDANASLSYDIIFGYCNGRYITSALKRYNPVFKC